MDRKRTFGIAQDRADARFSGRRIGQQAGQTILPRPG